MAPILKAKPSELPTELLDLIGDEWLVAEKPDGTVGKLKAAVAMLRYLADASGQHVTTGADDDYIVTPARSITALADGYRIAFRADRANTGAATLQVPPTAAKPLQRDGGTALEAGDIVLGAIYAATYIEAADAFRLDAGATVTAAAFKSYVDAAILGVGTRQRMRVATTADIDLATDLADGQTIDGVTLAAGDLVLVKDQSDAEENGVYAAPAAGAASRHVQFDTYDEHPATLFVIAEGTANADTLWFCTSNPGGTLGVTALDFVRLAATGDMLSTANLSDLADPLAAIGNLGIGSHAGFLYGLTLSYVGVGTFGIAAGAARDAADERTMRLTAAATKTLAAWAVGTGNGSLDAGTVANSTWYHVHLIRRPDTGVVDVLTSTSATAPTMPANYTQRRRIGSLYVQSDGNLRLFVQVGDIFWWSGATQQDVNTAVLGNADTLYTLSVPPGLKVRPIVRVIMSSASVRSVKIDSPDEPAGWTPGGGYNVAPGYDMNGSVAPTCAPILTTNTSAQIRARATDADCTLGIFTRGWVDPLGRLAP